MHGRSSLLHEHIARVHAPFAACSLRKRRLPTICRSEPDISNQQQHIRVQPGCSRRSSLLGLTALTFGTDAAATLLRPGDAKAALIQFPTARFKNRYFLVRAGESEAEADGYVLTNPVAKTAMNSGLSQLGKRQVVKATLPALKQAGFDAENAYLWASITQRSYQTAEILGSLLGIGRSRIIPEFSFLDPRGLGALEGYNLEEALPQVLAGDRQSSQWRPFRGTDGTPNESTADCLVRMRQVVSITETQWSGANIVIISPDSDLLSVLQTAVVGGDLRNHTQFAFAPGEARLLQLAPDVPAAAGGSSFSCPHPPACV